MSKSTQIDMTIDKKKYSKKFYIGIGLIISSLIVGKITQTVFILYFNNEFIRNLAIYVYIISWLPFTLGIAWTGMEYVRKYNRFFTIKYYKYKFRSIKE